MDVDTSLVADVEMTELGEPRQDPLKEPLMKAEALAVLDPATGDAVLNATVGQRLTSATGVVRLVGVKP